MIPPIIFANAFLIKNSIVKFISVKNSMIIEIMKVVTTKTKENFSIRRIIRRLSLFVFDFWTPHNTNDDGHKP